MEQTSDHGCLEVNHLPSVYTRLELSAQRKSSVYARGMT
jgi:hypothetical protein